MKRQVHPLFISLEVNLLEPKQGNSLNRHKRYAKSFSQLDIIVLTTVKDGLFVPKKYGNLYLRPTNSRSRWFYLFDAIKIIDSLQAKHKVDLISAQDPFITGLIGLFAKVKHSIPLNIQLHNDFFTNPYWQSESLQNRLFFFLGPLVLRFADSVRAVSPRIAAHLHSHLLPKIPCWIIPVPPDKKFLTVKPARRRPIDVIAVGRLSPQKNFSDLLRAVSLIVKKFPQTQVVIVGSGPERSSLVAQVDNLHLEANVTFVGAKNQSQTAKLLSESKIYLSTSNYEGSSISLIEAMLIGLPAVVTKVSGSQTLIKSAINGYLVIPGDFRSLAKHVNNILSDKHLYRRLARGSARSGQHFLKVHPESAWTNCLIAAAAKDTLTKSMKRANITHYDHNQSEIAKSTAHASKLIYYPQMVSFAANYLDLQDTLIDIGGGAGVLTSLIAAKIPDLKIIGLDISKLMCQSRIKVGLTDNLVGDMDRLPILSNSADAVIFIASIHHTLNTDLAIQEAYRILKPGGRVILLEHNSFRYLFQLQQTRAIPAPNDSRECLINHHLITHQLQSFGFIILHDSVHRQLVSLVEMFWKQIPLPFYRLLTLIDRATNNLPLYKELGNLSFTVALKPFTQ